MPKDTIIPMRPDNFKTQLTQGEQTALTWYILSGCSKDEAFLLFARPDMAESKARAVVKETIKQFYARAEVKEYLTAYRTTLEDLVNPKRKRKEKEPVDSGTLEERKARAKTRATEFAMSLAENIDQADDPEYVLKLMDKVGLLDGDEQVEVAPQRFLAERCSDCRYRVFCEQECEDLCQYCRYRTFGEESGVHYENKDMLDMPNKIGTKVAEEKVD